MTKITLLTTILCGVLPLLSSCSYLGIHSNKTLRSAEKKARFKGIAEGRAIESRVQHHQRQLESEKPQPAYNHYRIHVPPVTTPDGVNFAPHSTNIKVAKK